MFYSFGQNVTIILQLGGEVLLTIHGKNYGAVALIGAWSALHA